VLNRHIEVNKLMPQISQLRTGFCNLPLEFSRYEAGDFFSFGRKPGMPSYGFGSDWTHEEPVSFPSKIE
jgi:hypothetical protein